MPEIRINGKPFRAAEGSSVAAAILQSGSLWLRQSVTGERRGPFCGMGTCYECRAKVDGVSHERTCQLIVREGMEVEFE
jgi:sarcosine oxidase subunit alpha